MKHHHITKILGNILVAALSPFFALLLKAPKVIKALQTGFYSEGYRGYPDYPVDNFIDILPHIYSHPNDTFLLSVILLVLVLTPLAFYKEYKYEKGETMSFFKKWLILSTPFCIVFLLFFGGYLYLSPFTDIFYVLVLLPSGFALYLSILLHFIIDIWVEKPLKHKTTTS